MLKESFALLEHEEVAQCGPPAGACPCRNRRWAELARVGVFQAMSLTHKWTTLWLKKVKEEESKVI